MLGKNSGVATRLTSRYPHSLYSLYSQSNKNSWELIEAAQEVGSQVLKIGRVLNTDGLPAVSVL